MVRILRVLCTWGFVIIAFGGSPVALQYENVTGDWVLTQDMYGYPQSCRLTLRVEGPTLVGSACGTGIEGTVTGASLAFVSKTTTVLTKFAGTIVDGELTGTYVREQGGRSLSSTWSARRIPTKPDGPPRRHEFMPSTFYREFSWATKPVLTVWPGDTVHTVTIDAEGVDEHGATRSLGGNPQTGPFYVELAMPGDVLAIRIVRLRLNRDWAAGSDSLVGAALGPRFAQKMSYRVRRMRWKLDREHGVAVLETPNEHLKGFSVPLRPMLGCIAVAPGFAAAPIPTTDSGRYGGNMDFNEIVEGTTVFLPVSQPGALLYIGDGHAAQGSGELNGGGLETSMEVEFRVDVIRAKSIQTPRVESGSHIMAVGMAGSLDEALRAATASLGEWLEQDYGLTPAEVALVLGSSIEYTISDVVDRSVGIVAKLSKDRLKTLGKSSQ